MANLAQIYDWFMTGKKPTQPQFWASWGSFWNKEESIPQSAISNLASTLNSKAEKSQFDAHKIDENAHGELFTSKEDKLQKGAAGGYVPLNEFVKIASQYLSVVDDLETGGSTALASAETVKRLKLLIDNSSQSFPVAVSNGLALLSDNTSESGGKWSSELALTKLTLPTKVGVATVNEIGTDGTFVWFGVTKKPLAFKQSNVFVYTATGNFAISTIKTALEADGRIFNDCHIIVSLGTGNYTCSIDIGAANSNNLFTIGKRGTGSIAFSSTRTLNSGTDVITIMNGSDASMAKIEFSSTTDFLTVRNL